MLKQTLLMLRNNNYDLELLKSFHQVLLRTVAKLNDDYQEPNGSLQCHLMDIFIDELVNIHDEKVCIFIYKGFVLQNLQDHYI